MIRAISSHVAVKRRLHAGVLDALVRGGARAVEIFGARRHFDYADPQQVREIAQWFADTGVAAHSLHAPMHMGDEDARGGAPPVNVVAAEKRDRIASMDEVRRALETAERIPFRFLVLHLGTPQTAYDERVFDHALTAVEHLRTFAKPLNVRVLLENIPNELTRPEHLVKTIETGHFDDVGLCFDVGHAHLGEGVEASFETMKNHIRSTHVHDNRGDRDAHLWPGEGTIDWAQAVRLLRTAPHVPPLLLEIEGGDEPEVSKLPARMEETFRMLEGGR